MEGRIEEPATRSQPARLQESAHSSCSLLLLLLVVLAE